MGRCLGCVYFYQHHSRWPPWSKPIQQPFLKQWIQAEFTSHLKRIQTSISLKCLNPDWCKWESCQRQWVRRRFSLSTQVYFTTYIWLKKRQKPVLQIPNAFPLSGVYWVSCSPSGRSSRPTRSLLSWSWLVARAAPRHPPSGPTSSAYLSSTKSSPRNSTGGGWERSSHCKFSLVLLANGCNNPVMPVDLLLTRIVWTCILL